MQPGQIISEIQALFTTVWHWLTQRIKHWQNSQSLEYTRYQQQFLRGRVRIFGLVMVSCALIIALHHYFVGFADPAQFDAEILREYGDAALGSRLREATIPAVMIAIAFPTLSLILLETRWGRYRPALIFLGISLSMTLPTQIIGTVYGLALVPSWTWTFLGQAVLVPTHWRMHITAQFIPVAYYLIVYPLLGLTKFAGQSIYDLTSLTQLIIICFICATGLFTYEQMQKREFESRQQLEILLHSVTHDLQTPILGMGLLLKSILDSSDQVLPVQRIVLERLLEGSNRQLSLIRLLLDSYKVQQNIQTLNYQPLHIHAVLKSVLTDLQPLIDQRHVQVHQAIASDLPIVYADETQLWRVFSNLISNALKHNSPGIYITITTTVVVRYNRSYLRCTVEDNGVGISPELMKHLFQRYTRGDRARYIPGLGLGLYLCDSIIQAHQGDIGVDSIPGKTTFWFTLPLQ